MQCAYCGFSVLCYESSALHCSLLMVLCMHDTQMVSPPHLMQRECTNITQKERQVCSPFVKALHWVIFCWTFSVCATYRLCRHLVHHKCAMYRVVLCCVLFCVNSTQRMAACLHCECVVNYTYSIVNVLRCYIFYGDFLICTTMRVCYA